MEEWKNGRNIEGRACEDALDYGIYLRAQLILTLIPMASGFGLGTVALTLLFPLPPYSRTPVPHFTVVVTLLYATGLASSGLFPPSP